MTTCACELMSGQRASALQRNTYAHHSCLPDTLLLVPLLLLAEECDGLHVCTQ